MKLRITTYGLDIIPETAQDEIYIESCLKLGAIGDICRCTLGTDNQNRYNGGIAVELRPIEE